MTRDKIEQEIHIHEMEVRHDFFGVGMFLLGMSFISFVDKILYTNVDIYYWFMIMIALLAGIFFITKGEFVR